MPAPATSTPEQTVDETVRALDALDTDAIESMLADNPQGVDELSGGWRRGRDGLREYFDMLKESGIAEIHTKISDIHTEDWGDTALVTAVLDQSLLDGRPADLAARPDLNRPAPRRRRLAHRARALRAACRSRNRQREG